MRLLAILLFASLLITSPAFADETEAVKTLANEKINSVIDHLRTKGLDRETRNGLIVSTINPIFDFSQMAKLSMGKKNWLRMTNEQRQEFNELFVKRLQESYLEKLDLYTDEDVVVDEAKIVKKRIFVRSHLVSKDNKIEMIYKFYKNKNNAWLVYDLEIMGVSIVQTYRSQFAGILKNQSVDELLNKLREAGGMRIDTNGKRNNS